MRPSGQRAVADVLPTHILRRLQDPGSCVTLPLADSAPAFALARNTANFASPRCGPCHAWHLSLRVGHHWYPGCRRVRDDPRQIQQVATAGPRTGVVDGPETGSRALQRPNPLTLRRSFASETR